MAILEKFISRPSDVTDGTSKGVASKLFGEVSFDGQALLIPEFVDLRLFGLDYAVSKYPITNRVYTSYLNLVSRKKLLYAGDERFSAPDKPAVGINFKDAEEYCEWMAARFSLAFKLPDVREWETIARCNKAKHYSTPTGECSESFVNYGLNVGATTQVDFFPPNEFGCHDMTGNVLEWTSSIPTFEEMRPEYGAMPVKNQRDLGLNRILKGGSWAFDAANSRITATIIMGVFSNYYTTGFRPVIHLGKNNG